MGREGPLPIQNKVGSKRRNNGWLKPEYLCTYLFFFILLKTCEYVCTNNVKLRPNSRMKQADDDLFNLFFTFFNSNLHSQNNCSEFANMHMHYIYILVLCTCKCKV